MELQFVLSTDPAIIKYSDACLIFDANNIRCTLPSTSNSGAITEFGEYLISVVDSNTKTQLSDENILSIIILPSPIVSSASPIHSYI